MSIEKAKEYLESKGYLDRVMEFDVSSATVGHAPGGVCPFGILPGVRVFLDGFPVHLE